MALEEAVQNARLPAQSITWTKSDGTAQDLTGATITGRIYSIESRTARAIDGTLTATSAASGVFSWTYGAVDVGTAGVFRVQFIATFGGGAVKSFSSIWRVRLAF